MEAPEAFVRTPPARSATASTPESVPLLLMVLVLARETPSPPEEAIFPALVTVHAVPVAPLTPFVPEPVDVTAPVFVTNKGLLAALRTTGPVVLVLMVLPAGGGGTLMVKVSVFEEDELGPAAAACVAVTEWLALVSGVVGVKLQLPLATVVVPTDVPSIDTVTVSLVIPDPEMVGSAVVVIVLPLSGAVMVGAAGGGGGTLMVKVSVFEEDELGPAAAACVAVTEWLALVSGVVGVKLQLPLATVVVPTDVPSIDTVTVSLVIPDPEMVGSAVVVIVLPLSGAVMVGAAGGGGGTLMVKVSVFEEDELGPAAAACVAVTEWLALVSGVVGVKLQLPLATVVVPTDVPSIDTVTVSLVIPDPEMVGSAVVVIVLPLSGAVMVGAAGGGGGTLMVKVSVFEEDELGPAAAACVAVTEWLALVSGVVGVKLQLPLATVVVPTDVPSIDTVTVSLVIPDPEMVGSAVVVIVLPLSGAVMVGAAGGGGGTLMVKVSVFEEDELGPAAAACVAVTEWLALVSGVVGVKLQLPLATVVVPTDVPSIDTVTVSLVIPDPEMVGSAVVVIVLPLSGAVMVGAAGGGGGTLMVKVSVFEEDELGPAAAACVAVTEWLALVSGVVGVKLQLPLATVVVPTDVPSIDTVTVSLVIPDPEMVGSAVVVIVLPLSGAVMVGAAGGGGGTLMVKVSVFEEDELGPAAAACVAVTEWLALVSGVVGVKLQLPLATVVVPTDVPSIDTVTVSLVIPDPEMVGSAVVVIVLPLSGAVMVGAAGGGGGTLMVKVSVFEEDELGPAAAACVAVTEWLALVSGVVGVKLQLPLATVVVPTDVPSIDTVTVSLVIPDPEMVGSAVVVIVLPLSGAVMVGAAGGGGGTLMVKVSVFEEDELGPAAAACVAVTEWLALVSGVVGVKLQLPLATVVVPTDVPSIDTVTVSLVIPDPEMVGSAVVVIVLPLSGAVMVGAAGGGGGTLMVKVSVFEEDELGPAAAACVAVTEWLALVSGVVGVKLQLPLATVVVPTDVPSIDTVTVSLVIPDPEMVGSAVVVIVLPLSGAVMVGAAGGGGGTLMVKVSVFEEDELGPAAAACVAVTEWLALVSGVVGVKLQLPLATVVVPTDVPSIDTVTVSLVIPDPEMVGSAVVVIVLPLSGAVMVGAAGGGGGTLMVKVSVFEEDELGPAAAACVAVTEWLALVSGVVGVKLQLPLATVVVPTDVPSIDTVTVSLVIPDPEMVGSAVVVIVLPLSGAVMVGAAGGGGGTLMVKVSVFEEDELGPAAAACVAVTEWLALVSGVVGVKLQLPLATVVVPTDVPSIDTVTVSLVIPDPEMVGSAVVVIVLPLSGAVMVGAAGGGGGTLMVKVSVFEEDELGPAAAACVAVTEWLALVSGVVGVKLQLPLATVVVPTDVPSIDTVTVSLVIPDPEMVGSAVVVIVLPLSGAVMVGAAGGGGGTLMVKVSVFEEDELGPAAAACVAVTEWLALVSGVVGVKLQLPLATVVVPTDVPSIDTVTVSLVIPDPEMVGSAVVVIVLPLSGAVMVGAAGGGGGTLMVKVSVFEEDELGPAAAACVAVTEWLALVSGVVGVKLQLPLATVVVPTDVPSIDTVTVSLVIPDPEMVGSAVVVIVLPLSGAVMVGAAGGGGGTLMVKVSVFEEDELGPAAAACVAVTEWLALVSGVVGVKLQLPLATVVVPTDVPSIDTVTVSLVIPDPEMVGSAVVVIVLPLSGAVMVGAAGGGGGTLMVKVSVFEEDELGPAAAACVAVTEWLALVSGVVGVKLQLPLATVVVPTDVPSIDTVTVSLVIPDPEMVGSAVVVIVLPLSGAVMVGAAGGGGGTLMVKVSVFEEDELGPAAAACVAVTEWLALVSGVVGVKLQLPLATVVVPTDVPSIDTVTVSLVIPDPEMVGSAVVVIVLPLSGAVMVGAAGGGGGGLPDEVVMKVPLPPSLLI